MWAGRMATIKHDLNLLPGSRQMIKRFVFVDNQLTDDLHNISKIFSIGGFNTMGL